MGRVMPYPIQSLKEARFSRKKKDYITYQIDVYILMHIYLVHIQQPSVRYLEESHQNSPQVLGHPQHLWVGFCSVFWNF